MKKLRCTSCGADIEVANEQVVDYCPRCGTAIGDALNNKKSVSNITFVINIDGAGKDSENIANDITKALKEHCERYFNPVESTKSNIKECGVIEADLPKKGIYNPLPERDIFNPVESATATLKPYERTVRDTILDKTIGEKTAKFQYDCITYLKDMLNEIANNAIDGYSNDTEHYEKYIDSLNKIRKLENEDFAKIKESDLKQMLGFNSKTNNNCMINEIESIAKRIEEKESRD